MATLSTRLHTLLHGRAVGSDMYGNRYYEARRAKSGATKRRWVMYHGKVEPSKIPAEWHGWLHYTHDAPLSEKARYSWQAPHRPNLTATRHRHLPSGHAEASGKRAANPADYQPWQPS